MVEALNLPQTNTAEMFAEERNDAADAAAPPTTVERSAAGTESKEGPEKPPGAGLRKVRGPKRRTKTGCLSMSTVPLLLSITSRRSCRLTAWNSVQETPYQVR